MAESWTRTTARLRWPIVLVWLAVVLVGGYASGKLSALQSNVFSVPGTDSERVRKISEQRFGDRSDGQYSVVFRVRNSSDPALQARLQTLVEEAAVVVPSGRATPLQVAGPHVVYGSVISALGLAEAKGYADDLVRAIGQPAGTEAAYVTGAAAIQNDLDPIFSRDLRKGESIAIPIALLVLLLVFGLSWAVTIPFAFAASTVFGTLGILYGVAHVMTTPTYVTNLVFLIGLGIAVDYSLLIVYRFREELERGLDRDAALVRTMQTAGRAVIFSGATVAIGLALLMFMPLPFMRAIGVGGFLIPVVSIAAAATLQPALLSIYGCRGTRRVPVAPFLRDRLGLPLPRLAGSGDVERGFWTRLARSIMRRKWRFVAVITALLATGAIPVGWLQLTPGATSGIPQFPQSVQGFNVLKAAVGPGAIAPSQVLIDSGRADGLDDPRIQAAIGRLVSQLDRDPETAAVYYRGGGRFVDPIKRYAQVIVATRHEYGSEETQSFVHRLRGELIPRAGFPSRARVLAGGAPARGVDFLERAYSVFPWLVVAVLALTYVLLMRAFRSMLLPLKAVFLNLLSVAASYGALVVVFRWGVGETLLGLYQFPQIEGWIPIFLFAMLFGLSMDYEVFLVSRMRESWDETGDNARAVAIGLERTGRIVTAAAVIMVAAFSGFMAGSIVGLQEFGCGLAVAIFLDATAVRAVLVPAMMAILGRYNWWLPAPLARAVRVRPSPLPGAHGVAARSAGR